MGLQGMSKMILLAGFFCRRITLPSTTVYRTQELLTRIYAPASHHPLRFYLHGCLLLPSFTVAVPSKPSLMAASAVPYTISRYLSRSRHTDFKQPLLSSQQLKLGPSFGCDNLFILVDSSPTDLVFRGGYQSTGMLRWEIPILPI